MSIIWEVKQQELQEENPSPKPISILSQEMNLGDLNIIGFGTRLLIEDGKIKLFVIVKAWSVVWWRWGIVEYCWIEESRTLKTGRLLEWVFTAVLQYYNINSGYKTILSRTKTVSTETDWLTDWLTTDRIREWRPIRESQLKRESQTRHRKREFSWITRNIARSWNKRYIY